MVDIPKKYYDSSTGRFITEDPAQDGLNWYSYCAGDPVNAVDPWGLTHIQTEGGVMITMDGYNYWEQDGFENVEEISRDVNEYGYPVSTVIISGCNMDINMIDNAPFVDQDGWNWCWAASISEIVEYFTGNHLSMEQIVIDKYGEIINHGVGSKTVAQFIDKQGYLNGSGYRVNPNTYNGGDMYLNPYDKTMNPISMDVIMSDIDDGIPMIMNSGDHVSVIIGYIYDQEKGNFTVICRDSNYYVESYSFKEIKGYNIISFINESGSE